MMTQVPTIVTGRTEQLLEQVRRVSRGIFFATKWWETVSATHMGNDIFIETDRPIRNVYLNGRPLAVQPKEE